MDHMDRSINVDVSTLAWHLYHWLGKQSDFSLEACVRFSEFLRLNYAPRSVCEEERQNLYDAFMKVRSQAKRSFKWHKCDECGSLFTKCDRSACD